MNVVYDLLQVIVFGILSYFLLKAAFQRSYFDCLKGPTWTVPLAWYHVIGVFAIYFFAGFLILPSVMHLFEMTLPKSLHHYGAISIMTWANFLNSTFVLLCMFAALKSRFSFLWLKEKYNHSYGMDLFVVAKTLVLAFPVILCVNGFFDLLVHGILQIHSLPDQVAVQWVKLTFKTPLYFFLSTVTILILAPCLEELLFRACLQSFLRKHLGAMQAIWITSFCFACFHFSRIQGWNNLPIIGSLFPLAFFLGFVYEKRGSLFASISMHATFNGISLLNIYFFGHFLGST